MSRLERVPGAGKRGWPRAAGVAFGLAILWGAAAPVRAYEHRQDTPSVGVQIQYGDLEYDSEWGKTFGWGRGVSVHLRQSIARNRAIGLSFEQQRFEREIPVNENAADSECLGKADYFDWQALLLDYYVYFRRPLRRCYYAVASVGFYRPQLVDEMKTSGQQQIPGVCYPSENLLGRLGVGMEYFVSRKFSFDASVSGYYIRVSHQSGLTASAQFALGVHLYATR